MSGEKKRDTAKTVREEKADAVEAVREEKADAADTVREEKPDTAETVREEKADAVDTVTEEKTENVKNVEKEEKRRLLRAGRRIHEINADNDIRFRGILSYRHLRILGWIFLALALVGMFLDAGTAMAPEIGEKFAALGTVCNMAGGMAIFLFLFANFAVIIDKKLSFKNLFILYGTLTALFTALYCMVCYRYYEGIMRAFEIEVVSPSAFVRGLGLPGYFAFNVFLDLFLCTAVIFFIDYRPEKFFTGKKRILFRLLALLPITYELFCIILKMMASVGEIEIPGFLFPFLPTKPPMCFLLFVLMAFYLKKRERKYLRNGGTPEGYQDFLRTNANSYQFSKAFALRMFLLGILDFFVMVILMVILIGVQGGLTVPDPDGTLINAAIETVMEGGFGKGTGMILFAPFVLLFSYTKSYKNGMVDTILPVGGIALLAAVFIEGMYQLICLLPGALEGLLG